MFDGKEYNKCNEISSISNDTLLTEFKNIIEPLYLKDNIDSHIKAISSSPYKKYIVKNPINNPIVIMIPRYSGHSTARSREIGEFYTMYSKDKKITDVCGNFNDMCLKKSKSNTKLLQFYIIFNNKEEAYNFWKYTHTIFFQAAMRLVKTVLNIMGSSILKYVPYFNFSDNIFNGSIEDIDINLFKKYKINQNIINKIISYSNYYNLDLSKYKNIKVES